VVTKTSFKTYQEILQKYDTLFPSVTDKSIQELFQEIKVLFAYNEGFEFVGGAPVSHEMPIYADLGLTDKARLEETCNRIRDRLKMLHRYNITDPEKIKRNLILSWQGAAEISRKELKALIAFNNHPSLSLRDIEKNSEIPKSTLSYNLNKLQQKIGLRFLSTFDCTKFKLRHYAMFMRVPVEIPYTGLLQMIDSEFKRTLTAGFVGGDRDYYWAWASYYVPDQVRILREFKQSIDELYRTLEEVILYEITGLSRGVNLDNFDTKRWFFPADVFTDGLFAFVKDHEDTLPMAPIDKYSNKYIRFDKTDFLIALNHISNTRASLESTRKNLEKYQIFLSPSAICKRLQRLQRTKMFLTPTIGFNGLGIPNFVTLVVECERQTVEFFQRAITQFPRYVFAETDSGFFLSLYLPDQSTSRFIHMLRGLQIQTRRTLAREPLLFYRFENVGSRWLFNIADRWNTNRQYWDVPRGEFKFPKPRLE
jgi:hypothetical protein